MILEKHYNSKENERKWIEKWRKNIYNYQDSDNMFIIDTPPPTVSGHLHIGHVFNYTHIDIIARFHRLIGQQVVFPIGWDDNGLPIFPCKLYKIARLCFIAN